MARGYPDFGQTQSRKQLYTMLDSGELAARLGSIITFDRRGDVVWFDDFESPLERWEVSGYGTGIDLALDTSRARSGCQCMKLTTPSSGIYTVGASRYFHPLTPQRLGIEVAFSHDDDLRYFLIYVYRYDGVEYHQAIARVDFTNEKFQIQDDTATFVDIETDVDLYSSAYLFHCLKIVIDFDTDKYVRAMLGSYNWDLSAYSLYSTANTEASKIRVCPYATAPDSTQCDIYLDDFILTQNEP